MGRNNNRRSHGASGQKSSGRSDSYKRFKVKYGGFTFEGSGQNAVGDMLRAGAAASSSYGMMKQIDQSTELGKMIANVIFGELFGGSSGTGANVETGGNTNLQPGEGSNWIDVFHENHQMPLLYLLPYQLGTIIGCFPRGFAEAMILHLLVMFGALCFSRIRAKYLDGKIHSPSLQVIIEATSGSGKGKFKDVFDMLFSRVKEEDDIKYAADDGRGIIQIVGINTTPTKFFQITARNKGVHMYMIHPEIIHAARILKKSGGLSYEHLRCAFDNDEVEYNSMARQIHHGRFRVYLNYTFTGTQQNVESFIAGEEVDGTAQRICWSTIPENDDIDEGQTEYPEATEMEYLRDQIDEWRRLYCFNNDTGVDEPCQETEVDLEYVKRELSSWIKEQSQLADTENNPARKAAVKREAAIAFHLAMVLHMLYEQPGEDNPEDRSKVVAFTLYLANYCMERYLLRFGKKMNDAIQHNRQREQVNISNGSAAAGDVQGERILSPKELYDLYHQNDPSTGKPWSYNALAEAFPGNGSDVTIIKKVNNYAADNGLLVRGQPPKRR